MKNTHIFRLKKGEELVSSVLNFCQKIYIESAWFSALGAAKQSKLAFYDLNSKSFIRKNFMESLEIVSLVGNIATLDGKLVSHCHVVLSDKNMKTYGGHLDKLIVAATCEIILKPVQIKLTRKYSEEIGLNLLEI